MRIAGLDAFTNEALINTYARYNLEPFVGTLTTLKISGASSIWTMRRLESHRGSYCRTYTHVLSCAPRSGKLTDVEVESLMLASDSTYLNVVPWTLTLDT